MQEESFGGLASVTVIAGNFGMANNGSHYFEMFRFMTDEPPATVAAWFSADRVPNPRGLAVRRSRRQRCGSPRQAAGASTWMRAPTRGMACTSPMPGATVGSTSTSLPAAAGWWCASAEHRAAPTTRYGMPWEERDLAIAPADAVAPTRAVLSALLAGRDYPDGAVGRIGGRGADRGLSLARAGRRARSISPMSTCRASEFLRGHDFESGSALTCFPAVDFAEGLDWLAVRPVAASATA